MRVIAGAARGIKLKTPRGREVRPTADRVKEALFGILGPRVIGAGVVDLFAGSGALGIEALSRGADHCTFVEKDKSCLQVIRENLARTGLTGRARLIGLAVPAALERLSRMGRPADLIFMDPPYRRSMIVPVLQAIHRAGLPCGNGLVVIEHPAKEQSWAEHFSPVRRERYGNTAITFIDRTGLAAAPAVKESPPDNADEVKRHRRRRQESTEY